MKPKCYICGESACWEFDLVAIDDDTYERLKRTSRFVDSVNICNRHSKRDRNPSVAQQVVRIMEGKQL